MPKLQTYTKETNESKKNQNNETVKLSEERDGLRFRLDVSMDVLVKHLQ